MASSSSSSNSAPVKSRLGKCEICKINDAKYTCPACEMHTCSLDCVRKHKKDFDCDGIRVRTSFVKLNQFTDSDLLSDLKLLEDISRVADNSKRDKAITKTWSSKLQQPHKLNKLKVAVRSRGTHLILLPDEFAKHKANTTFYDWETKELFWSVQLIFLNASEFSITEKLCSEMIPVKNLIEKYVFPSKEELTGVRAKITNKLNAYAKAELENITILLKAEGVASSAKKFYKLDPNQSIRDNLVGKTIVEYPQFYFVINEFFTTKNPAEVEALEKANKKKKIPDKNLLLSAIDQEKDKMDMDDFNIGLGAVGAGGLGGLSDDSSSSSSEEDDDFDAEMEEMDEEYLSQYKSFVNN